MSESFFFPVLIRGERGAGKRSFGLSFVYHEWQDGYDRTYDEKDYFTYKKVEIDGKEVVFDAYYRDLDCEYSALRRQVVNRPHGVVLLYSITDRKSFDCLELHYEQEMNDRDTDSKVQYPVAVCGHKCDLAEKRVVETCEGKSFADSHGFFFFETSAKTFQNEEEVFYTLYREFISSNDNDSNPDKKKKKKKEKCIIC